MKTLISQIKKNWLTLLIISLPILDIISYFAIGTFFNSILTVLRFGLLILLFFYSFIISENKKSYLFFSSILVLYFIGHIISGLASNYINIFEDISNLLRIFYFPILLFSFINIFKNTKNSEKQVVNGITIAFIITIISIIISLITNTANYTYGNNISLGIIGWFYNKNTQSLILIMLAYISSVYSLKKKSYYFLLTLSFIALYYNATKSAYISLLLLLIFCVFYLLVEIKDKKKLLFTLVFIVLALGLYHSSPTYKNLNTYNQEQNNKLETGKNETNNLPSGLPNINSNLGTPNQVENNLKIYEKLYKSYSLGDLIDTFGLENVLKKYNYTINSFILSNTRMKKRIVASLIYENENTISHLFGFEFTKINHIGTNDSTFDLENDLTALFYYLGYIGIALYALFILYFLFQIIRNIFYDLRKILASEYMIWLCLTLIMLFAAEYTGALLRRPNASIYLAIILAMAYTKFSKKKLKNKISFLSLHLGYGGIESATINTANALIKNNYKVEIISFYNLKRNQVHLLNSKVEIKYLYHGEPNKEAFLEAFHHNNYFLAFKEGLKSLKILFLKKYLIISTILKSDSKVIVSTRYDFSKLLSKYKQENVIAIAQEHHHHNNNAKYIKVLKHKYSNIDYLMALTEELAQDYQKFLINNKHTQIIIMPNMLTKKTKISPVNTKNVIFVGRLEEVKRVNELIDIVSQSKEIAKFYIIGDGSQYSNLKNQISELQLTDKVKLLGYLEPKDQVKYYLDSSIFLMASLSEGLPMVLLEAMSYGLPCIAYETPSGVKDIISDKENGYIIQKRNSKEYISQIDLLLNNPQQLKAMSSKALKKSEQFWEENIILKWQNILDPILSNANFTKLFSKTYTKTKEEFLNNLEKKLINNQKQFIVTANPEAFMIAQNDSEYYQMLIDEQTTIVADGIGLVKAAKILGNQITERIPGVDIAEKLLSFADKYQKKVYLFGAKEEVLKNMQNIIKTKYPNLILVGHQNGYVQNKDKVFQDIIQKQPDICLVALGMPLQEKLIYKYYHLFKKGIFIGVGGSLDVLSGTKKRAPKLFINLNLEWLYRILKEPKRIKRFYDNNIKFLIKIKQQKN